MLNQRLADKRARLPVALHTHLAVRLLLQSGAGTLA
jgi:hypothetical protein